MVRRRGNSPRKILIALAILTILVLFWVDHRSNKIELLKVEEYTESYETEALVIRNEEVVRLDQQMDLTVAEGDRVGLNQKISDSTNISFSDYYDREIDMINWLLENKAYQSENVFDSDIEKIDKQIEDIEGDIKWANTLNNEEKKKTLEAEKENLLKKKNYILKSFQYLGADEESLIHLKEEYTSMKDTTGSQVTPKKLNFSFPGYIYFQSDGYESLLNINVLQYMTPDYMRELENYSNSDDANYKQTIKVIDDTYMYLAIVLPEDVSLGAEKQYSEAKKKILDAIKTTDASAYYHDLNTQNGNLKTLPILSFVYGEEKYQGYMIDLIEQGDEKVLIIEVRDRIPQEFFTNRKADIELITYSNTGYVIPEKSVVRKDDKDYIVLMSKGSLRENVEVKIGRRNSEKKEVFLDVKENENINDGTPLILNP